MTRTRAPRPRDLRRDERGMAVAAVMFLGLAVMMLTSVIAVRAFRQSGSTAADAEWETTLHVAESGLDDGLVRMYDQPGYTTGEVMPSGFDSPEDARAWVLAAADARPGGDLRATSGGEYVVVRPANTAAIFSIGYVPSRDAADRRVRIVHAMIDDAVVSGGWYARYAVLAGGELLLNGNPTIISGATVGVHTNDYLDIRGSVFVDGCLSASGSSRVVGSMSQDPGCGTPGVQAPVEIPAIDVRSFWEFSMYDLCPSGVVKAGPAHPTQGNTIGSAPCTGATLTSHADAVPFMGWRYNGWTDTLAHRWRHESTGLYDGVFYVYRGSADMAASPGSIADPWQVTLLVEGIGSCPGITGGDIDVSGSPVMEPYPETRNLLLGAGRDIDLSGSPTVVGLIAAHEQIDNSGGAQGSEAALLSELACDSVDDTIDVTEISGNLTITNTGPISTPFPGSETIPVVAGWGEL
ncbi:MAG: hypothetical protein KQH83_05300 [Actinobacteria bacterium]|nr:hypothetical protein [Actinomycetota bacterium]